jgi:hypothetical protein
MILKLSPLQTNTLDKFIGAFVHFKGHACEQIFNCSLPNILKFNKRFLLFVTIDLFHVFGYNNM